MYTFEAVSHYASFGLGSPCLPPKCWFKGIHHHTQTRKSFLPAVCQDCVSLARIGCLVYVFETESFVAKDDVLLNPPHPKCCGHRSTPLYPVCEKFRVLKSPPVSLSEVFVLMKLNVLAFGIYLFMIASF